MKIPRRRFLALAAGAAATGIPLSIPRIKSSATVALRTQYRALNSPGPLPESGIVSVLGILLEQADLALITLTLVPVVGVIEGCSSRRADVSLGGL
jgi:hypothetical protein